MRDHQLKTYIDLTQLGLSGTVTMEKVCEALPDGSRLTVWNSIGSGVNLITDAPSGYCIIVIERRTANYVTCQAYRAGTTVQAWTAYYRSSSEPSFSGWVPIATAMPPVEHELTLGAGIVAVNRCFYYKTQENIVNGYINLSSANPISQSTLIATLLPNYRPNSYMSVAYAYNGVYGEIGFHTDGKIQYYGTSIPANTVCRIVFPPFVGH